MLLMLIRKMLRRRWLILGLLIGSIVAMAMAAGVPVYTEGILHRMLIKDLQDLQRRSWGIFPGAYQVRTSFSVHEDEETRREKYRSFQETMSAEILKGSIDLPILAESKTFIRDYLEALPVVQREEDPQKRFIRIQSLTDFDRHIEILHGKMYSSRKVDGALRSSFPNRL